MTGKALRSALGLWAREPKVMLLMNVAWALPAFGGVALAAFFYRQGSLGTLAAVTILTVVWMGFSLLVRAVGQLERGQMPTARNFRAWLTDAWAPRLVLGLACIEASSVVLSILTRVDSAGWPKLLLALAGAAWLWLALGTLISAGLDAPLEQPPWAAQKAGLMAAVAFLPSALALGLWTAWLSGSLALVVERTQWWARLFWAPLILAPVFTPSFYAGYLYFLAQGVKDRSQGKAPLDGAPTIMEILRPWR